MTSECPPRSGWVRTVAVDFDMVAPPDSIERDVLEPALAFRVGVLRATWHDRLGPCPVFPQRESPENIFMGGPVNGTEERSRF